MTAVSTTADLCRLILAFRLAVIALTVVYVFSGTDSSPAVLVGAILVSFMTSYVPFRDWRRVGPLLARHPALLAADVLIATFLLAVSGTDSPFVYFTMSTAMLAGVLYGVPGAAVFLFLELCAYGWATMLWLQVDTPAGVADTAAGFQTLAGNPGLYVIAAAAGVALRRMLDRYAAANHEARMSYEKLVAAEERARLAREMHDSLAKTLHGIALSASALSRWVSKDPDTAVARAGDLSDAAAQASREVRTLIGGLRRDSPREPLHQVAAALVRAWSVDVNIPASVDIAPNLDSGLEAETRYQVLAILAEALTNVERHAEAKHVGVALRRMGDTLEQEVHDNGRGIDGTLRPEDWQRRGHYGIIGMAERARRVGGELRVMPGLAKGTAVFLRVPIGSDGASGRASDGVGQESPPDVLEMSS